MSFLEKVGGIIGFNFTDDEDDDRYMQDEYTKSSNFESGFAMPKESMQSQMSDNMQSSMNSMPSSMSSSMSGMDFPRPEQNFDNGLNRFSGSPKVVNYTGSDQLKMIVINPDSYDEAREICDYIRTKKPVVVNLESMDYEIAQRVMDFLSGSCYSLNGNIQRVAKNIFIVAPDNIDVTSDFKSEMKHKNTAQAQPNANMPWMTFNKQTNTGTQISPQSLGLRG